MIDLFESPKRSILRAHHHIADLAAHVRAFEIEKAWSYVVDDDTDSFHKLHKIRFARRLPDDLPSILFDAVNNLRAALDQCAYASAIAAKGTSLKHVKFPFANDQAHWLNAVRGSCKDLPPEIRSLFERCNAYKGGNDALWALNEICNTKKHFALVPLSIGSAKLTLELEDPTGPTLSRTGKGVRVAGFYGTVGWRISPTSRLWDARKNELLLLRTDPKPKIHYHADVAVSVAIEGIDILRSKPAVGVLEEMLKITAKIGAETEAECRRLGFIG